MDYKQRYKMMYCGTPPDIYAEIKYIIRIVHPDFDFSFLDTVFTDLTLLFYGEYPGFQASKTKYHDFPHTCWVALAVARSIHAHTVEGKQFSKRAVELGIITALFHDTGLIQEDDDTEGTGAKFTIGHEERSIRFLSEYLFQKGEGRGGHEDVRDLTAIISCTILAVKPSEIEFFSEEVQLIGYILGSADLLAQMAERAYLEKLPLLFEEFKEGGVPGFESSFDLLKKTEMFYKHVVLNRLDNDMEGMGSNMRVHFRERWGVDRDLYAEAITNQIDYLKKITQNSNDSYENVLKKLRRTGEIQSNRKRD